MGFLLLFIYSFTYFYFSGFPETIQFLIGPLSNRHLWILALAFLIKTNRDWFQASNCKLSALGKWLPSISRHKVLRFSVILSAEEILSRLPRFCGRKECYQVGWLWWMWQEVILILRLLHHVICERFRMGYWNRRYYYFSEIWLQESLLPQEHLEKVQESHQAHTFCYQPWDVSVFWLLRAELRHHVCAPTSFLSPGMLCSGEHLVTISNMGHLAEKYTFFLVSTRGNF